MGAQKQAGANWARICPAPSVLKPGGVAGPAWVPPILCSLLLLAVPLSARAATSAAASPIVALDNGLARLEKSAATPFAQRYAALAPAVDAAFNLPHLLQAVVGLKWAEFSPADQAALLRVFRAYTICAYVANFNTDAGDQFVVLPEARVIGPNTVVETEIVPKTGDHARVDYVMRPGDSGGWQAIDVLVSGTISQTAVQRSDFRAVLEAGGAPKLIESLTAKVHDQSGGTITP